MKNIFYLLLFTPIIYLTSCSSGGGSDNPIPTIPDDISGVWELKEYTYNGMDAIAEGFSGDYYYWPDGTYGVESYYNGSSSYGIGTYSLSNDKQTSAIDVTILTGDLVGVYASGSNTLNWINENEYTISSSGTDCLSGEEFNVFFRIVKTTNSLGPTPSFINNIVGVWEATVINFEGQDVLTPNYSEVLLYFTPDGSFKEEAYYFGGMDWSLGTYTITGDQTSLSLTTTSHSYQSALIQNPEGQGGTSINITDFKVNEIDLHTSNYAGTGLEYSLKASKKECTPLYEQKSKKEDVINRALFNGIHQ